MPRTTLVSAPGKVLLAGGYLVLDPAYLWPRRLHLVQVLHPRRSSPNPPPDHRPIPTVPRRYLVLRRSTEWRIPVESLPSSLASSPSSSKNKFVELALKNSLSLILEMRGPAELDQAVLASGLDITIVGDNDFYSQQEQVLSSPVPLSACPSHYPAQLKSRNLPSTLESLSQLPPFLPTQVHLPDVSKTGLGSSAALITSLVTALLVHASVIPPSLLAPGESGPATFGAKQLAHNLAQFVHCLAQGKVAAASTSPPPSLAANATPASIPPSSRGS
ncbi:hypothetical protein EW146_g10401 [Bondarzewia mesenterica]|uniref:phosphomevalonate kinase n=1 Tax=Bondarzewia mesenterica TaxID=1095465 RepID=A0A4S4KXP1_9AGAM|nr:hypothetical protein EW146_g10401 [Bondarzewia mesenterica]